jgi:hypothetical protein
MNPTLIRAARATAVICLLPIASHALAQLAPQDDINSAQNGLAIMPQAQLGSEYPTHGNRQAGELPLNPVDPRAQLANGLPNNAQAGGYGSPLAGVHSVPQP